MSLTDIKYFFRIFRKKKKKKLLTEKLLEFEDLNEDTFFDIICPFFLSNEKKIFANDSLKQSSQEFFEIVKNNFPTFYEKKIFRNRDLNLLAFQLISGIQITRIKDMKSQDLYKLFKCVLPKNTYLIDAFIYMKNLGYNLLNELVDVKKYKLLLLN